MARLCHYAASKWGLVGLTKSWAIELAPYNIRVIALCPTGVNTPMNDGLAMLEGKTPREIAERSAGNLLPMPWIEPEDVAAAVVFLASQGAGRSPARSSCSTPDCCLAKLRGVSVKLYRRKRSVKISGTLRLNAVFLSTGGGFRSNRGADSTCQGNRFTEPLAARARNHRPSWASLIPPAAAAAGGYPQSSRRSEAERCSSISFEFSPSVMFSAHCPLSYRTSRKMSGAAGVPARVRSR